MNIFNTPNDTNDNDDKDDYEDDDELINIKKIISDMIEKKTIDMMDKYLFNLNDRLKKVKKDTQEILEQYLNKKEIYREICINIKSQKKRINTLENEYNENNKKIELKIKQYKNKLERKYESSKCRIQYQIKQKEKFMRGKLKHKEYEYDRKIKKLIKLHNDVDIQIKKIKNDMRINEIKIKNPKRTENICCICIENEKNCVYTKCGHFATCYECSLKCNSSCPICRTNGNMILKIYNV